MLPTMSLISAEGLASRLSDPQLRIADVRWYLNKPGAGRAAYASGHIPGAVFVDLDSDLAAPTGGGRHPLPLPADFARRMGQLGIGSDSFVVAYDDANGTIAARLWWMLDALGHADVAVLDGGIQAWTASGGELSTEPASHAPATISLGSAWPRTIDQPELRSRLGELTLLDARAAARYRGEIEPVDPAAGHIPTARNAPSTLSLGSDGRFASPDELAERYRQLADGREVVVSCGSGVTACHTALAMRIAGLPDPLLYPGSFSDWSRSGLPVVAGEEPGAPS